MCKSKESLPELRNDINYQILCRELKKQSPERQEVFMADLEQGKLFLSIKEFAEKCGVPEGRVRRWIKQGEICAVQKGRIWMIPVKELDELMNEAYGVAKKKK